MHVLTLFSPSSFVIIIITIITARKVTSKKDLPQKGEGVRKSRKKSQKSLPAKKNTIKGRHFFPSSSVQYTRTAFTQSPIRDLNI